MDSWKKSWKTSTQPTKQRKYRENAPYHHRTKFVSASLADNVADRIGTGSLPVREGDKAEIMRGDFTGLSGQVERVDYDDYTVYISGIDTERVDGTEAPVPIDPSNIKLKRLEMGDDRRLSSYEISQEDRSVIQVEEDQEEAEEVADDTEDAEEAEQAGSADEADDDEKEKEDDSR